MTCAWVQGQPPLPRDLGLTATSLSLSLFFCQMGMTVPVLPTGAGVESGCEVGGWRCPLVWGEGQKI